MKYSHMNPKILAHVGKILKIKDNDILMERGILYIENYFILVDLSLWTIQLRKWNDPIHMLNNKKTLSI